MSSTASDKRQYRMVARAEAASATRERLLASAWRHFSERPFDDVRLSEVAADAKVSAQTLHTHFKTKDRLFVGAWGWRWTPEGTRRDEAPVGDVAAAVPVLYDSYAAEGDAVLRLLPKGERIPAVRRMADGGRRWHRRWVERTLGPLLEGLTGAQRERRLVA